MLLARDMHHISDHTVSVSGYNIIRRDRKVIDHGGVFMYVRESIRFETLSDFTDENFEVLWVKICPPRLPRGISSIVVGTVYHPPRAGYSDRQMSDYLLESLSKIEARFPNCGLIILGDFNNLNSTRVKMLTASNKLSRFQPADQAISTLSSQI